MTKRILCFGDSLTWGWVAVPEGSPTTRFPYAERWTGVMAAKLGPDYEIIEEGLSARTTSIDDPADPRLNGSAYLPSALASHLPLDLAIIMLGTNDTKSYFHRTPYEIAVGMSKLVGQVLTSGGGVGTIYPAPKVLIVSPPPLAKLPDPWFQGMFEGGHEKTIELANQYSALAAFMKVDFFDAGSVISTDGVDGIHFTAKNNADLGRALAGKVADIFATTAKREKVLT
ncbi:SGNH/GDSL hydrolase family protein [Bradyrhizobium sp. B097]|uniref:SGNH/GDSL hydrolase family protein n=1 Tax=unclassified Bradyrhizobium TaxID=2631580 RepID=UPI003182EE36